MEAKAELKDLLYYRGEWQQRCGDGARKEIELRGKCLHSKVHGSAFTSLCSTKANS